MVDIIIGGDVCPINRNAGVFNRCEIDALFNDLLPEFLQADLAVVNLECPLVEAGHPVEKVGPVLRADPRAAKVLRMANIEIVNLANNHILDHGEAGLRSTISACVGAGIEIVGADEDARAGGRPIIRTVRGIRIALLAYAESEAVAAGVGMAFVNTLNLADYVRSLRFNRHAFDYLIVLLHAGVQHHPYPSPALQDTCRFMIEEGADAVICQHSHCPGAVESYLHGHIVYGQGNLLFDRFPLRPDTFYQGFLVRLTVGVGIQAGMELIPYRQSDQFAGARRMTPDEAELFLACIREKSERVQDPDFMRGQWAALCKEKRYDFYSTLRGHGRLARVLNRKMHFSNWAYDKQKVLNLHNMVTCESHREVLETILAMDARAKR